MAEHSLRQAAWIVRKDLQHELRSREAFLSTLLFAVVVLLIFAFAFDPGPADIERVGPGILWSALLFAAVLAIGRSMLTEREDGAIDGLLLAPMQRSSIYVGKACALLLLLLSTQLPTLLLFVVFFDVPVLPATTRLVPLLSVLLLASTGLAAIGTTVSAIAVRSRSRELMLPVLLFPLVSPLLLAAVESTSAALAGDGLSAVSGWIRLMLAFDAIYLGIGYLTFPALLED